MPKKGYKQTAEHRAKILAAQFDKLTSPERKAAVSAANRRRTGWHHSEETKAKMSAAKIGHKMSDEQKAKLSEAMRGNKYNVGRKLTAEHKAKLAEAGRNRVTTDETRAKHRARWEKWRAEHPDRLVSGGYETVFDPRQANGRSPYHRIVMEQIVGRELTKTEKVHHIDGDRRNNDPGNLYLCASTADHRSLHFQLEAVAMELVRSGVIVFAQGQYVPNPQITVTGVRRTADFPTL